MGMAKRSISPDGADDESSEDEDATETGTMSQGQVDMRSYLSWRGRQEIQDINLGAWADVPAGLELDLTAWSEVQDILLLTALRDGLREGYYSSCA